MQTKKMKVEGAISEGAFVFLPVSETTCRGERIGQTAFFFASKIPVAIVVLSPTEKRAFRISGEEISLDALTAEVPDILGAITKESIIEKT
jgi:uncharacterized spore protein YtfJ